MTFDEAKRILGLAVDDDGGIYQCGGFDGYLNWEPGDDQIVVDGKDKVMPIVVEP